MLRLLPFFAHVKCANMSNKNVQNHEPRLHLDFLKGFQICDMILERSLIKLCDLWWSGFCRCCHDGSGGDAGDAGVVMLRLCSNRV